MFSRLIMELEADDGLNTQMRSLKWDTKYT